MNVTEIINEAETQAIRLWVQDGTVFFAPRSATPPELLEAMRQHKEELQSHLEAQTCRLARLRAGAAWLLDHDRRWQDRSAGAAGDALFGKMLHLWADLDEKLRADYGFKGCVQGTGRRCDDTAPVRCLGCAR